MGLIPPDTGGLFSAIDQKTAYAAFKASGSFDPDTLYAQKQSMLGRYRTLKRLAACGAVVGVAAIGVGLRVLGAVLLVGSWMVWRFQDRQARNVEAGYGQYVGAGDDGATSRRR